MHSFASNFKNFTNQNPHFLPHHTGPPWGALLQCFPCFLWPCLQTPNFKTQCILLHLTSRILQITTHFFFTPQRAPGGVGMLTLFPSYFLAAVQTLNFKLQWILLHLPSRPLQMRTHTFFRPQRALGGECCPFSTLLFFYIFPNQKP